MSRELQLHIIKPGLFTTVQDQGRAGYQAFGVPVSGALDQKSASIANLLVGNPEQAPVLEITMMGPTIQFERAGWIAITGANLSATINGTLCHQYQTLAVKSGDILKFGRPMHGCRAYLAVAGQWHLPKWLGSYSAITQNGTQLTPASILTKGQIIQISGAAPNIKTWPIEDRIAGPDISLIHVMPGPEFEAFSRFTIGSFFSQTFTISPDSNRMGYRLKERLASFKPKKELISSGVIPGTIQITGAGQPILLLADAQTTGGYYRLANVISYHMDVIAQLKPGDQIRFALLSDEVGDD